MDLIIITGFTALVLVNLIFLAIFLNARSELSRKIDDAGRHEEQRMESLRKTVDERLQQIDEDNRRDIEIMRQTVDEKLQKTLSERFDQSFKLVSDRLEEVYKGLGEMQNLAGSVGDLKKVLSNVKTRGIFGEIQLGAILEQLLSPEQYATNVAVVPGSSERVEYAISMPGEGGGRVYLPVDAKFPADYYQRLVEAYDSGDSVEIEAASKALETRIKMEAKTIHDKYVCPPYTTDFAIMFLPTEGLYAEVCRKGMIETLQRECRVSVAGPTTMAALLNSLQMGFRTLAIQKHSSEVWTVLGAVKTEFDKFGTVLAKTQERLNQAERELDSLIGTRTNVIRQKLKGIQNLTSAEAEDILGTGEDNNDFYK